ncbi:MAG: hypothetical protein JXA21_26150 [Anaerolineae bacterium]|nr:hypothetical protein [Anaerolineae bacterium]
MNHTYPAPNAMRRPDGSARFAFVTLLMLNDNYLPGVLAQAFALRRQKTQADLACLVTEEITAEARDALKVLYTHVIEVDKIFIPYARRQARQYVPFVFTRMHALRMGAGGDLGLRYEKVVELDADVLPMRHYDHLFSLPAPAGILNERKEHFLDYDAQGRYIIPPSVATSGTWRWHAVYDSLCPHGARIPQEVTDRVRSDPTNMGVNSAVLVFAPSQAEFDAIREDLTRPDVLPLVGDAFEWPDMQYLTMRWSGQWTNIDVRFCGFSGYPNLKILFGTHYAGLKPWHFHKTQAMARYGRFEDFQYWFAQYRAMLAAYPALRRVKRLAKLLEDIKTVKS